MTSLFTSHTASTRYHAYLRRRVKINDRCSKRLICSENTQPHTHTQPHTSSLLLTTNCK